MSLASPLTLCEGWLADASYAAFFPTKRRYFRLDISSGVARLAYWRDADATEERFSTPLAHLRSVEQSRSNERQ